jgi:hypothetical protein
LFTPVFTGLSKAVRINTVSKVYWKYLFGI